MTTHKTRKRLAPLTGLFLAGFTALGILWAAETAAPDRDNARVPANGAKGTLADPSGIARDEMFLFSEKHTNLIRLAPAAQDKDIARFAATVLHRQHYLQRPIDDEVSIKFLERYLDMLDPQHLYFLELDLKEFEGYRTTLDELTVKRGDTTPAHHIFTRFLERFRQQIIHVNELLSQGPFDFTGDDVYVINRKQLPRPKDLEEARKLWRDRLRYEYLQEKLGQTQPEVIARILEEKLPAANTNELRKVLLAKLGKEKVDEILLQLDERRNEPVEKRAAAVKERLEQTKHRDIIKTIIRRYSRLNRMLHEYDSEEVLQMYLTALAHVYDPHSDYMGRQTLENFAIGMKLSLTGIGALLQSEDGYCKIKELTPGGPAIQSKKLKPGDRIIAVAQGENESVDVVDMKLSKVVDMIRGPKGTVVKLTVIPVDAPDPSIRKSVTLVRDEIKLEDQEAKARLIEVPGDKTVRLGVIDLSSFYAEFVVGGRLKGKEPKSTTTDVKRLIRKLKEEHIDGLILDLRRNGGGSLEEAINLTGLFIPEGPVVQVRDSEDRIIEDRDEDPEMFYDGPLVVLTSRMSASASEIVAGALQDYGRAVVVGDSSTHGKGTVQSLIELRPLMQSISGTAPSNNPGALKITIRKFYRANGSSTQLKGVIPDLVLPSLNNHAEVGEGSLENALPWDTIPSAKFQKLDVVPSHLDELKRRSDERLTRDRDYAFLRQEIERYQKALAEKSVSLNEAKRWKEKQEAEARAETRKTELKTRPEAKEKIYEITLKTVDVAGLPAPAARTNETATADSLRPDEEDEDASVDEKIPSVDITLEETKRILIDLIALAANRRAVAAQK